MCDHLNNIYYTWVNKQSYHTWVNIQTITHGWIKNTLIAKWGGWKGGVWIQLPWHTIVNTVALNLQIYIQYPKITIKEAFIWWKSDDLFIHLYIDFVSLDIFLRSGKINPTQVKDLTTKVLFFCQQQVSLVIYCPYWQEFKLFFYYLWYIYMHVVGFQETKMILYLQLIWIRLLSIARIIG